MGFYIRKPINFGGVRFNFSKSGIGASVGVKGFRVGTGARGNYVHMGRGGLYYRAALGTRKASFSKRISPQTPAVPLFEDEKLIFHEIKSAETAQIVDSSSREIVDEINAKRKKLPLWPLALLFLFIPNAGIILAAVGAILIHALADKKRKTTVLVYDIEEETEQAIQEFYSAFDELANCNMAWHVSSQAAVHDKKYHAGANQVFNRATIRVSYKTPKYVKTNVKVPAIPVSKRTIFFFPDRILIFDKKSVGGLSYGSFSITRRNQRFIESGITPRDGTVVDHTWQYVNKSGGPDRRFSNNRQLPVLLYSEVSFLSDNGLNELIQFSKQNAGVDLVEKLEQYKRNVFVGDSSASRDSSAPAKGTCTSRTTVDERIQEVRTTQKEDLYFLDNINALITLLNRIISKESCPHDDIVDSIRQLEIKDVSQNSEHFAPVGSRQAHQSGRYTPEKIKPKPSVSNQQSEPYATIRAMKQVGGVREGYWGYYPDDAETFYKQAQFMKDFVDHYDWKIPLDTYYSTYSKMDDAQLRTYFTWRTKVRQGIIEDTSLSYAFCYIFELINDVGVNSPDDAIERLIALWTAFRKYNDKLDSHMREWIRDYYVVHKLQLSVEFSEYCRRFPVPYHREDMDLMAKAKSCSWDDLSVIEASSSFKITNGQFYKATNQEIIEKCACFVIQELAKLFKQGGVDFKKIFFEIRREKVYSLFRGAVHRNVTVQPITVRLDEFETMKLNSRGWHREYITLTQYRAVVGYILKCIEVKMRARFGYKRNLQMPNISQVENCFLNSEQDKFNYPARPSLDKLKVWKAKAFSFISSADFETAIVRAITDYCKIAHIVIHDGVVKEIKPVEIDMSKLKTIEKEHMETAAKLIIEEQPEPVVEAPSPTPEEIEVEISGIAGLASSLPDEGRTLLITLLDGGQAPPNSELLIETINEKALEAIADNIIDYSEGLPYVYDDYADELISSLGGK